MYAIQLTGWKATHKFWVAYGRNSDRPPVRVQACHHAALYAMQTARSRDKHFNHIFAQKKRLQHRKVMSTLLTNIILTVPVPLAEVPVQNADFSRANRFRHMRRASCTGWVCAG